MFISFREFLNQAYESQMAKGYELSKRLHNLLKVDGAAIINGLLDNVSEGLQRIAAGNLEYETFINGQKVEVYLTIKRKERQ